MSIYPRDKMYPASETPPDDAGADRETRERPCTKRTWCVRGEHEGAGRCVEAARYHIPPSDFGPNAAKRRRW